MSDNDGVEDASMSRDEALARPAALSPEPTRGPTTGPASGRSATTIEARSVSHSFTKDVWALRDVTFALRPGVTALVGVNGAGKSTLLSVLAGGARPTAGSVYMGDGDLYGRRRRHLLTKVALMPQHLTLPESLTCAEVVAVIGWMRGLSGGESRRRADEALDAVGLADQRSLRVKALSGGMRRRVALAQAIVGQPEVLLPASLLGV